MFCSGEKSPTWTVINLCSLIDETQTVLSLLTFEVVPRASGHWNTPEVFFTDPETKHYLVSAYKAVPTLLLSRWRHAVRKWRQLIPTDSILRTRIAINWRSIWNTRGTPDIRFSALYSGELYFSRGDNQPVGGFVAIDLYSGFLWWENDEKGIEWGIKLSEGGTAYIRHDPKENRDGGMHKFKERTDLECYNSSYKDH